MKKKRRNNTVIFFAIGIVLLVSVAFGLFLMQKPKEKIQSAVNTSSLPDPYQINNILLAEASKENIKVLPSEVDTYIKNGLTSYQMTEDELKQTLAQNNITYSQYKIQLQTQLTIWHLIEKNVDLNISVTEQEITDYIDQNQDDFKDIVGSGNEKILRQKIKNQIIMTRQEEAVKAYIATLKS